MAACFLSDASFFACVLIMFTTSSSRRTFLLRSAQAAKMAAAGGLLATASMPYAHAFAPSPKRANSLAFEHLHTNERLSLVYAVDGAWLPQAKSQLDYFLRDHYTGDVGVIDPQLFDLLHRLRMTLGVRQPYQVISGYRTAFTNERLRTKGGGGVAKRSLHMDGKAIDIRVPGVALTDLRDAALSLKAGGVGFYARENFVHVDTGAVRSW